MYYFEIFTRNVHFLSVWAGDAIHSEPDYCCLHPFFSVVFPIIHQFSFLSAYPTRFTGVG